MLTIQSYLSLWMNRKSLTDSRFKSSGSTMPESLTQLRAGRFARAVTSQGNFFVTVVILLSLMTNFFHVSRSAVFYLFCKIFVRKNINMRTIFRLIIFLLAPCQSGYNKTCTRNRRKKYSSSCQDYCSRWC